MSQLRVRLLGPPEALAGDTPLSFPARKALALLIYLIAERGMHDRDRLAALLWPASDPSRVRATLRNGLHQLRSSLPENRFLHVERDALGFDFSSEYWLDLDVVRRAVEMEDDGDAAPTAALHRALELYRGDFLEGFTLPDAPDYEAWIVVQRSRWQQKIDILFDRLSDGYARRGRADRAQAVTGRWLEHDPLNEKAYRRQMRLLLASGNRAAALQAYERCRTALATELAVEPAPETIALAARIEREPATVTTPSDEKDPPARDESAAGGRTGLRFAAGPLVGRADEFGALVEAYQRAARGEARLVQVLGEPGIGKSRLVDDFLAWAAARDAVVGRGLAFESGRQLPYQPLVDALRPLVEAINAPEDYLPDPWLAELSRLLPELLERYPDLAPARADEAAARTRLFEAVTRLTVNVAERQPAGAPLILFFDDMQWADSASLDVLQYAGRCWRERNTPLLLVVAIRSDVLRPRSASHAPRLVECLEGLERHLVVTTLALEPLSPANTGEFVAALGEEMADDFARWLFARTGGQPFYLVETLEDLRERGVIAPAPGAAGVWRFTGADPVPSSSAAPPGAALSEMDVPEKVRRLIVGRLARLSPPAFDLLAAGAVLARGFTFELLRAVAGVPEGEALRALDELLHSQLLREAGAGGRGAGPPSYRFAHDRIRDVAYDEAGAARRRVFHRRALGALAERSGAAGELARHALAAGQEKAAFHHALAAGDASVALFAPRNAIGHLEMARDIARRLAPPVRQLRRLYLQLGRAHELEGEYGKALEVYEALERIARDRGDRPLELAALMARTTVYAAPTQHYDPEHVRVLTERALPLARELSDHAAESKIQWNLMLLRLFAGDIEKAVAAGEASLAIARAHDLRERMAYALHDLTRAYLFSGRAEAGLDAAEEARGLWRRLENKALLVDNLISSASARFFWQGNTGPLIPQLEEALALSREIDNRWTESYAQHILGTVYYDLGRFGPALAASERAIELGLQAGFMVPLFTNGSAMAVIYGMAGQPEQGEPWVRRALEEETGMQDQRSAPLAARAFLHLCRGDLAAAEEAIRRSRSCLQRDSLSTGVFFTFPIEARLRLAQGAYERALAVGQELIDHLRRTGLRFFWPDGFYVRGRAFLALGRVAEARGELRQARESAAASGSRRVLWEIAGAQAEAARASGEEAQAAALARDAGDVIHFIAENLDDESLARLFLSRPDVRAILDWPEAS